MHYVRFLTAKFHYTYYVLISLQIVAACSIQIIHNSSLSRTLTDIEVRYILHEAYLQQFILSNTWPVIAKGTFHIRIRQETYYYNTSDGKMRKKK
jgi:hypothetical protein